MQRLVNYGHKKFFNIGPWAQCFETFYGRNLRVFVISESVYPWQAFQAWSNKHSSLVQKLVNYGQKSFLTFYGRNLQVFVTS